MGSEMGCVWGGGGEGGGRRREEEEGRGCFLLWKKEHVRKIISDQTVEISVVAQRQVPANRNGQTSGRLREWMPVVWMLFSVLLSVYRWTWSVDSEYGCGQCKDRFRASEGVVFWWTPGRRSLENSHTKNLGSF